MEIFCQWDFQARQPLLNYNLFFLLFISDLSLFSSSRMLKKIYTNDSYKNNRSTYTAPQDRCASNAMAGQEGIFVNALLKLIHAHLQSQRRFISQVQSLSTAQHNCIPQCCFPLMGLGWDLTSSSSVVLVRLGFCAVLDRPKMALSQPTRIFIALTSKL